MAYGHRIGKYWKYHNSLTNGPIGMKLGWSHPMIVFPTCLPWCGCHSDGRWPLPSNGALNIQLLWRLEAEHVNRFW